MEEAGGWQEVRRRNRYPDNWRHSNPQQPTTKPYIPFSLSYAQVVCQNLNPSPMSTEGSTKTTPPPSRPTSPNAPATTVYYVSPHSPSRLRFPPSSTFTEWKGRCFKCCRTGHTAANCRNSRRCGRCWSYGHIGSRCKQAMVPPSAPKPDQLVSKPVTHSEPGFEELLTGTYPYRAPAMPAGRPLRLHVFIERDEVQTLELQRLQNAVVMHTGNFPWDLNTDNAGDYAIKTGLVSREEIEVSELAGSRFLIVLPKELDPETFINATPQSAWDEGIHFQPWSPLDESSISVPAYKILVGLTGVPPYLWREKNVAQAVARFGVYLGSVKPENPASLTTWMAAVGVDDLSLVPIELAMHAGGMVHTVTVRTIAWKRAPLYSPSDMPKQPKKYTRPQPSPAASSSDDEPQRNDQEPIVMSRRVLRDICRGRTADSLPPELRQFATLEEMTMDDPHHLVTGNPSGADQEVQQGNQKVRLASPSELDQEGMLIVRPGGAGQENPQSPTHFERCGFNQSRPESSLVIVPNETNVLSVRSVNRWGAQGSGGILIREAGQNTPQNALPHKQMHDSTPRKILQRPARAQNSGNGAASGEGSKRRVSTAQKSTPRALNAKLIQNVASAKDKGPIETESNLERANVTRPNSGDITLKQIQLKTRQKRKKLSSSAGPSGSVKKTNSANKDQVQVSLNPEGFYEARVQQDHVSNLAARCGFKNRDVEEVIRMDNAQRQLARSSENPPENEDEDEEMAYDLRRFEPDPNDELTSDEE